MPSSTTNYALPYPLSSDNNNVPSDMAALATAVDTTVKAQVARPVFFAVLAANQSLTVSGAGQTVLWPTETIDDLNWHSTSSNTSRVTPTLPGRYLCNFSVMFAASATGERRAYVLKNGSSNHIFNRGQNQGANSMSLNVTGLVICNGSTDYIETQAFQSSGGALDMLGAGDATFSTSLEVVYLGNF